MARLNSNTTIVSINPYKIFKSNSSLFKIQIQLLFLLIRKTYNTIYQRWYIQIQLLFLLIIILVSCVFILKFYSNTTIVSINQSSHKNYCQLFSLIQIQLLFLLISLSAISSNAVTVIQIQLLFLLISYWRKVKQKISRIQIQLLFLLICSYWCRFVNGGDSNTTIVSINLNKKYIVQKTEQLFKYNYCFY